MKKFAVALVAVTLMLGLTTAGPVMAATVKPVSTKTTTAKHHHKKHKHHKKHTTKTSARVTSRHAAKVA